jgi:hypothetical protein
VQRLLIDHPLTYLRIALVFSVRLEYFFKTETKPVLEVVRKQDRLRFPETPERRYPAYYFESLDFRAENRKLNSYYAEFQDIDAGPCTSITILASSFFTSYPGSSPSKSAQRMPN